MNRLLILEALTEIAGGESVLIDLLPALTATCKVDALLPGDGALQRALQSEGVEILHAPMNNYSLVKKNFGDLIKFALEQPRMTMFARRSINRLRSNIVYGNNSRTLIWGTLAAALTCRPIIWHIHNIFGDHKTMRLLNMFSHLPAVKRIICASAQAADQFADVPTDKLKVIASGVDLERFAPAQERRAEFRAIHSIEGNTLLAGIVGDLIPLKGQLTFIEATSIVHRQLPDARFWIIGHARPTEESQSYEAQLRQSASGLPIDFIGFQTDMPAVLNALDALIIASISETGPLVLLEALSCGIPVLSTPAGRSPELLGDGVCGDLFPIGNAAALAQKLITLFTARERQTVIKQAARERAIEKLSLDIFRKRVLAEITAVLKNGT